MCGIAGIFVGEPARLDARTVAARMQIRLTHRGPDDHGLFVSNERRCALAHTRLSILDLSSAGHQPMSSADGRYSILFNGEIYNYLSLREELGVRSEATIAKSKEQGAGSREPGVGGPFDFAQDRLRSEVGGHNSADGEWQVANGGKPDERAQSSADDSYAINAINAKNAPPSWQSNTDTEVILRAYAKWGRECVNHLRGMFSFAIWDQQKQELFLARDPLGIKPLYYCQTDHSFLFASEVRALLASGLVPSKLSKEGLTSYLQFGSVQDPLTTIDGVLALLPGHVAVIKLRDGRLKTDICGYWSNLSSHTDDCIPASRPEAVKLLREKLEESVRLHLVSDVPLGAFLSGGIDSSAIVAVMSRVADRKPKTFSVVFKESEFSEAEHARLVARTYGTDHREILLSEDTLFDLLPSALEAMDQPTMDGINTYVVSKAVKEAGITVALSGLGGDELFAGYPSFQRAMQLYRLGTVPFAIRRFASTAGRTFSNGSARRRKFWDMVESDCSPYAAYAISRQLFAPAEVDALMNGFRGQRSEIRGQKSDVGSQMSAVVGQWSSVIEQSDVINAVSRYELRGYMANTLLRDTDQMSMAHALEVRVPFVDPEVVNYVFALPGEWKINGGRPKPLLVDALEDLLPEEIWRRPKMGFTLPFQRWMQSGLQTELDEVLSQGREFTRLGLSPEYVSERWNAFKENPQQQPWSRPWALYVLKKWCEQNGVHA
jgi:asparagine synthase (glutamine-hydrolysing)